VFPLLIPLCVGVLLVGIRMALMESDEHNCPSCETPGQSPDVLIPNKYLRAMVTSFINETSYVSAKKQPVSAPAVTASTTLPTSAVVVKSESSKASYSGKQPLLHLGNSLPVHASQIKAGPTSSELVLSTPQSAYMTTVTQPLSMPGSHQSVRMTANEQNSYRPSRSAGHRTSVGHQRLSHHVSNYSQPLAPLAGSSVGQSMSAPSLLTHNQPQYVCADFNRVKLWILWTGFPHRPRIQGWREIAFIFTTLKISSNCFWNFRVHYVGRWIYDDYMRVCWHRFALINVFVRRMYAADITRKYIQQCQQTSSGSGLKFQRQSLKCFMLVEELTASMVQ